MNEKQFEEFVEKQKWRKAITAQRNPHEYIVRHKNICGTDEEFIEAAMFVRQNGFKIVFWNREYIVYALNNRFYWTMEENIQETNVFNRNDLNDYVLTLRSKFEYLR